MAKGEVRVDTISRLEPPTAEAARKANVRFLTVELHDGSTCRLDMAFPHSFTLAKILEVLHGANQPVYFDIEPDTRIIQDILFPRAVQVTDIAGAADGDKLVIGLRRSSARSFIRTTNPAFATLLSALTQANNNASTVLVTDASEGGEILDVRPAPMPQGCTPVGVASAPATQKYAVGPDEAREAFRIGLMATCDPLCPWGSCIPFLFPDNGCWARAHEMCRLLTSAGFTPNKIWLDGNLCVKTRNSPACEVCWPFHVAPTLLVDDGNGGELYVLDPALFEHPVPQDTWIEVQRDPNAQAFFTDATVYYRDPGVGALFTDPESVCTNNDLITFRCALARRAVCKGPPPYANCP
jgi:hypothetical protein